MFLKYTEDAESPTSYFRWAAYTTLAATLRDNVWLPFGYTKLYPNMYTLILSRRSSLVKKSTPLKVSLHLLQQIKNTRIVSGRATIAGIIQVLTAPRSDPEGNPVNGASGVLYSEEMSALLIEDDYATDTLTDWYDGHKEWTSTLGSGDITIENLHLSILASSNEELIRSVFNSRATGGGLLARTMLIIESHKRKKNSLMYFDDNKSIMLDGPLLEHLRKVSKLKGPMRITEEGKKYYDEWYHSFEPIDEESSYTGIEGRIHVHALKLAMVKSVSEGLTKIIEKQHIEEAITECLDLLPNYQLFAVGNTGPLEELGRKIVYALLEAKDYSLPKKKLLWKYYGAGSDLFNKVIDALVEVGNIETYIEGDTYCLRLTKEFLQRIKQ